MNVQNYAVNRGGLTAVLLDFINRYTKVFYDELKHKSWQKLKWQTNRRRY